MHCMVLLLARFVGWDSAFGLVFTPAVLEHAQRSVIGLLAQVTYLSIVFVRLLKLYHRGYNYN